MIINKSFRYRIYPNTKQVSRMIAWDDSLRWLWNLANEQRLLGLARSKSERKYYSAYDQHKELTELRAAVPWLADVPRSISEHLLLGLDDSWTRCFKKIGSAPRWKQKGRVFLGFTETHHKFWNLKGNILRFPKLGNLRTVVHRPLEGKPKSCTIKKDGNQWFASIMCEVEIETPVPRVFPVVALDRGVINTVADSDGNLVESPRFYTNSLKRLTRAQRSVSRKKKGSSNQKKAKARVAKIHQKIRRQRKHFIHVLSSQYSKSHGVIVVENLNIRNMVRSASGTMEEPGTNVQQKKGLNRSILDSGWGMLADFCKYKQAWSGGSLVEVPAHYSSQTCSACGHVDSNSRKGIVFLCTKCGHEEHADTNAARVLKQRYETTPGNPWCQPVEGKVLKASLRNRKQKQIILPATECYLLTS